MGIARISNTFCSIDCRCVVPVVRVLPRVGSSPSHVGADGRPRRRALQVLCLLLLRCLSNASACAGLQAMPRDHGHCLHAGDNRPQDRAYRTRPRRSCSHGFKIAGCLLRRCVASKHIAPGCPVAKHSCYCPGNDYTARGSSIRILSSYAMGGLSRAQCCTPARGQRLAQLRAQPRRQRAHRAQRATPAGVLCPQSL